MKLFKYYLNLSLCLLMCLGMTAQAQTFRDPYPDRDGLVCGVQHSGQLGQNSLRAFPSRPDKGGGTLISKDDKIYVFRLAVCITPQALHRWFNSDKSRVPAFWTDLEKNLNILYERDLGIRFQIIQDDRLIPDRLEEIGDLPTTQMMNDLIGRDNYEVGIFITPSPDVAGRAFLGGAQGEGSKSAAKATNSYSTIAHEIGHLFGSEHTHFNFDGTHTEVGRGQSIMSYGYPRTFFSLPSVRSIRATLKNIDYFTDPNRSPSSKVVTSGDRISCPYVITTEEGTRPTLDAKQVRQEYVVTRGTYFQFYIPTRERPEGCLYNAHPFDISKVESHANVIQHVYEPSHQPVIMFHPRYQKPPFNSSSPSILESSDMYRNGVYTYYLSAFKNGQHDVVATKIRIVDGEKFEITKLTGPSRTTDTAVPGQTKLELSWRPCTSLYGTNSKVRILLSTDFGQTFKYVLADNEPNDGAWSGICPYVDVNMVHYPRTDHNIRGAVIKVEVIGEAAYALSHTAPYVLQGSVVIPTGGFKILKNDRTIEFENAPEIYLEVESSSEIPEDATLKAKYKGQTTLVTPQRRVVGDVIYRTWTTNISGQSATYTQVIKVKGGYDPAEDIRYKVRLLSKQATDLYRNLGNLGYPKADLPQSISLKQAYEAVYDAAGNAKSSATMTQIEALEQQISSIGEIADEDIVYPTSGRKYKIVSYHNNYGNEYAYYLSPSSDRSGIQKETLSRNASDGAVWNCQEVSGYYQFTSAGYPLDLSQTRKDYNGMKVVRGYTWGSFSLISVDKQTRIAQVNTSGEVISYNQFYFENPIGVRTNIDGGLVSTDFRFIPVDEAYEVYFITDQWQTVTAELSRSNRTATTLQMTALGAGKFSLTIPQEYATAQITFKSGTQSIAPIQLLGRSATYSHLGGQTHRLIIPSHLYTTLYLDYPVDLPEGIKAYTAIGTPSPTTSNREEEYTLNLTEVTGTIPAKTPVIIHGKTPGTYQLFEHKGYVGQVEHENHLAGSIHPIGRDELDLGHYIYIDLTKPGAESGNVITYNILDERAQIAEKSAYYMLYKYDNTNYLIKRVKLNREEFGDNSQTPPPPPAPKTYAVTLSSGEGGSISIPNTDLNAVEQGSTLNVQVQTNEGYELVSLTANNADIKATKQFVVNRDTQVVATFAKQTFAVTQRVEGNGTLNVSGAQDLSAVPYGTELTISATPASGHELVSITANGEAVQNGSTITIKQATSVVATFRQLPPPTPKRYTVTLSYGEGGSISIPNTDLNAVEQGSTLNVQVQTNEGYELVSLTANDADIKATKQFVVNRDTQVVATFAKQTFAVTQRVVGNGTLNVSGAQDLSAVPYGTQLTISAIPASGHELVSITANGEAVQNGSTITIKQATSVVATFRQLPPPALKRYKVTLNFGEGGSISIPGADLNAVEQGSTLNVQVQTNEGYELVSLTANDADIKATKQFVVNRDTQVVATFAKQTFAVTQRVEGNGTLNISGVSNLSTVPYGTELTISATPASGHELVSITANGVVVQNGSTISIKQATNLVATFRQLPPPAPKRYKVTLNSGEGGSISIPNADLNAVEKGTTLSVEVQTNEGYELVSLTANGADIKATKQFVVNSDTQVVARFAKKTFVVTKQVVGNGTLNVSGVSNLAAVPYGTQLTISATPATGYELASITANSVGLTASKKITITENTTIEATFKKQTFRVVLPSVEHATIRVNGKNDLSQVGYGEELTLEITPEEGYIVDEVRVNGVALTPPYKFAVMGPVIIEVKMRKTNAITRVEKESVRIYPNPASHYVSISGVEPGTPLLLMTLTGRVLREEKMTQENEIKLPLNDLEAGIYILLVGQEPHKIVVR